MGGLELLVSAYILAKVETGKDKDVVNEMKMIPEVKKISLTYGAYDIAIEATFETIEDLDRFVFDKLRKDPKVKETLTVICSLTVC